MKLAFFITGTTGAGKTTLARHLSQMGWPTFHTGDMFRKLGLKADGDNPVAPVAADEIMYDGLATFFKQLSEQAHYVSMVAVETIPRKFEQVQWLKLAEAAGYVPVIVILDADYKVREARVTSRDMANSERLELDKRKLAAEDDGFLDQIIKEAEVYQYPVIYHNTSKANVETAFNHQVEPLKLMLQMAYNLFVERSMDKGNTDLKLSPQRMADHLVDESNELADAVRDGLGKTAILDECVDLQWFLLLVLAAENISLKEFTEAYMQKAAINGYRQDYGTKPHVM